MKVALLVEDYKNGVDQDIVVTPYETKSRALIEFKKKVESDRVEHDDTVQTLTEDFYENYQVGCFDEEHAVIYVIEKEVL